MNNKQTEALKIFDKEVFIALISVIATWAIPIYLWGANGMLVALGISLMICVAGGSEDGYD